MVFEVVLGPRALEDLAEISDYIVDREGAAIAAAYLDRIETACRALRDFPRRGSPRDDLVPGLRTIAFERRATIAYRIVGDVVTILRVLHHGRDMTAAFEN